MSVRFKFRSSVNFDSVDIDGKPSISVADLKSKILSKTHLPICHDFDLIFSDAVSGQEFRDEDLQILSGSSVIIKRVPAGSVQSDTAHVKSCGIAGIEDSNKVKSFPPMNVEVDNLDDFGSELCPVPEATDCGSDLDMVKRIYHSKQMENSDVPRCSKTVQCQKIEASDVSQAVPIGPLHNEVEEDPQTKSKPKGYTEIERVIAANPRAMQNADFPSELKCPLCNTFFKEAVMIPCCQHSFCEKCIHPVLVDKGRCPKCLSTRCGVQHLLPNVSLRQAIEHFIQSQILFRSSVNALDQYAPDGESGIQAKEVSYGVTVHKREAELPHSPSTTGRGSNHITAEVASKKSAFLSHKLKQIDGRRHGFDCAVGSKRGPDELATDFQGENHPLHEEEFTSRKKRALGFDTAGLDKVSMETARQRRGDRTCYMCGSPDHLIRDCPAASSPHPMLQSGNAMFPGALPSYVSPYWHGTPFHQMRPFVNPYGNPGIIPFNTTMMPATAFPVPTYVPSGFCGMSTYGGLTRMGGVATSVRTNGEGHLVGLEGGVFHGCEKRDRLSNQDLSRGQTFYDDEQDYYDKNQHYTTAERPHGHKYHGDRAESVSNSEGSYIRRSHGKHRQDNHYDDDPERSSSEVEDVPGSSHRHSDVLHEHRHKNSKKNNSRGEQYGSDSSRSHHRGHKEKDIKRKKIVSDVQRDELKHHSQPESGLERSFSGDQKAHHKVEDLPRRTRHSRSNSRSLNSEWSHERWQMVSRSDEDAEEDRHYCKRKRGY